METANTQDERHANIAARHPRSTHRARFAGDVGRRKSLIAATGLSNVSDLLSAQRLSVGQSGLRSLPLENGASDDETAVFGTGLGKHAFW